MKANILLAIGCLCVWSGCNMAVQGTWGPESVSPEDAAKAFAINTVTFNSDDTFALVSGKGEDRKLTKGTYSFNGFQLKLRTDKGREVQYDCMKVWDKLEISTMHEGQKAKMVLAKSP
jgi:hypothetical protein